MRPAAIIILQAMINGERILINHQMWGLDDNVLYVVGYADNDRGDAEEILLKSFLSLSDFITMCNKVPEKDLAGISMNTALRDFKNR